MEVASAKRNEAISGSSTLAMLVRDCESTNIVPQRIAVAPQHDIKAAGH